MTGLSAEEREELRGLGQGQVPAVVEAIIARREEVAYERGLLEGYERGLLDPGSAWMSQNERHETAAVTAALTEVAEAIHEARQSHVGVIAHQGIADGYYRAARIVRAAIPQED